jgi:ABC-type sulfate transport system substrate-binding protein
MRAGRVTSKDLVESYLARISAYDKAGPNINAFISLNPRAGEEAAALDAEATADPAATPEPTAEPDAKFPIPADLFTIRDFGGWPEVVPTIFGEEGVFTQIIAEVKGQ